MPALPSLNLKRKRKRKKLKVKNIIDIIESVAPLSNQSSWDNSGLQIGDKEASVSSVLLCTDVTDSIVNEAIEKECQMIVSHHPLLFHPLRTIQGKTMAERVTIACIQHGIAVYSAHTSLDSVLHGISGRLAEKLGVENYRVLEPREDENVGVGVIGELAEPQPFEAFLSMTKEVLGCSCIRYIPPKEGETALVKTVAMCGGAGADLTGLAIEKGADVFISADWKHHEFLEYAGQIGVMDVGHFESEQFASEILAEVLVEIDDLCVVLAENDKSPVRAI